ncbi:MULTISPECIES: OmpA family protein [unclassified Campylobacter]|uniref:OmpA family protein n=1 Tax=unclassified Campylobacter TaxID=2593542 RepID=UPI0022E99C60|nr:MULTISPECIES: OmpA family protein [unclassified Campylobacter]MDA3043144.1 OmpA family protein [Campylobacter sp. JMF_09 ED2]MDA3044818.1 OmpA family protein [Campylobacter sp. JMF_07 ED4]MDA3063854.1 OmpA family protein [Campylobacter sp. JMF_11 EL3]MDA3072097.1 OmpA family protein [Campylobacter sp. VBCF_03 NA9]MDA3075116.1 OmpA family protein [Campylobacter sp. JMF_05 ED3]
MKKVLLALSLCASSALLATDADYHWEITPTIGGMTHEGNMDLDSNFMAGLRLAKNLQDSFIDQIELGFDYSRDIGLEDLAHRNGGKEPNAKYYHINLVKDLVNFTDNFKLYGLTGVGYMDYSKDVYNDGDQDSGFWQYGLGMKYYITRNFATKLEARDAIRFEDGNHVLFYTLGFAVDFGKRFADAAATGCVDSDNDGVCDDMDRCPGTAAGVVVDEYGCEKVIRLNLGVNFATDSSKISDEYMSEIKNVSDYLNEHSDYSVILEGHTDSTGSDAYNQKLSERRAAAVAGALQNFGVDAARISSVGYGESQPIATNATKEGRAQNRRVDAKFRK